MSPHHVSLAVLNGAATFAPQLGDHVTMWWTSRQWSTSSWSLSLTPIVDRRVAAGADIDSAAASVIW